MALSIKITDVIALPNMRLLVGFENGIVKLFDVGTIVADYPEYSALQDPALFTAVHVTPGGYGVVWSPELDASEGEIWQNGIEVPLAVDDLRSIISLNTINTAEVCGVLSCSRQNVDDLIRRGKLHPLRSLRGGTLFLKSEVTARIPY